MGVDVLTETKDRLKTYAGKDLQHFIHLLSFFEQIGADLVTCRSICQSVLNEKIAEIKTTHGRRIQRERVLSSEATTMARVKCTVCGWPVKISAVNVSARTNIGGDYRSVAECLNPDCLHQEYSEKFPENYK